MLLLKYFFTAEITDNGHNDTSIENTTHGNDTDISASGDGAETGNTSGGNA